MTKVTLSPMAERVLARMRRNPVQLYVGEIAQGADLSREDAIAALWELEDRKLVEAVSWRIVEASA